MDETMYVQAVGAVPGCASGLMSPSCSGTGHDGTNAYDLTAPSSPSVTGPTTPAPARYQTMLSFPFFRRSPPSSSSRPPLSQKEMEEAVQQSRSIRVQRNEQMETQHTQAVMSKLRGVNRPGKGTCSGSSRSRIREGSAGRKGDTTSSRVLYSPHGWNTEPEATEERDIRPFKQRVTSASSLSLSLPTYSRKAPPVVTHRVASGVRARKREPSEADILVEYMVETFVRRHVTPYDHDRKGKSVKDYGNLQRRISNSKPESGIATIPIRPKSAPAVSQTGPIQTAPWRQMDAEAVHTAIAHIENRIAYSGMGSPLKLVRAVRVQIHSCVLAAVLSPGVVGPNNGHPALKTARISSLARAVQVRDVAHRRIFIELVGVSPERWLEWLKFGAGEDDVRVIERFSEGGDSQE